MEKVEIELPKIKRYPKRATKKQKLLKESDIGYTGRTPCNYNHKFARTISRYISHRFNIRRKDLDMILFLYDEHLFNRTDFLIWQRQIYKSKFYMKEMIDLGYIRVFKEREKNVSRTTLYTLSVRAKTICRKYYEYNNLEAKIPLTGKERGILRASCRSFNWYMDNHKKPSHRLEKRLNTLASYRNRHQF